MAHISIAACLLRRNMSLETGAVYSWRRKASSPTRFQLHIRGFGHASMSQHSTLFRCSLVGTLLQLAAQHAAANVTNANFFYMPSFSEPVPSAIAGDTLNVSWSSNYAEGVLMVHCNDVQGNHFSFP